MRDLANHSGTLPVIGNWDYLTPAQFFAPRTSHDIVNRKRLIDRLETASGTALSLVIAPAGFGKTTLLANWIKKTGRKAAWLSIGDAECTVDHFALSVAASIRHALKDTSPDFMSEWHTSSAIPNYPHAPILAARVVRELCKIRAPFTLVLDDYHHITESEIHSFVYELVCRLPDNLNVTLAARRSPALPLSRLRVQGLVREIGGDDMRFNPAETAEFLKDAMGLKIADGEIAKLSASVEGWIAGLQLAAVGMKDGASIEDLTDFSVAPQRFVFDFLFDEVLQRQQADVQDFLLRTSVLERMTASLCDAITNCTDGARMLARLRAENLFITAVDEDGQWFRYHALFRSLLLKQLEEGDPILMRELHQRASRWFAEHERLPEAIKCSVDARNWEEVVRLMEGAGLTLLLTTKRFRDWLKTLPPSAIENQPILAIWRAWSILVSGNIKSGERAIMAAEKHIRVDDPHIPQLLLARAFTAVIGRDGSTCCAWASQALEHKAATTLDRGTALGILGLGQYEMGKPTIAEESVALAIDEAQRGGAFTLDLSIRLGGYLGAAQALAGRLTAAESTLAELDQLGRQNNIELPPSVFAARAEISFMRNDLFRADTNVRAGLEAMRLSANELLTPRLWYAAIRVRMAGGQLDAALAAAEEIRMWCKKFGNDGWLRSVEALRARISLELGRIGEAGDWLRSNTSLESKSIPYQDEDRHMLLVRWRLMDHMTPRTESKLNQCAELIGRMRHSAEADGRTFDQARAQIMLAHIFHELRKPDDALASIDSAAQLLLPEHAVRPLFDDRVGILRILSGAKLSDRSSARLAEVRNLLHADSANSPEHSSSNPIVMVSDREREILALVALGLTNEEIADSLVVSHNTVKSHIKNLYFKLQAHSRTQAVSIARAAGLL
jgi:LuxR family transcriptional regulator, maltose regulon positive regulatory protein